MQTNVSSISSAQRAAKSAPSAFSNRSLIDALSTGDGFRIQLQPQFHLQSKNIVGAEALIRWRYNENNISPTEFVPILEQLGLESLLFEFVHDQVCDLLSKLQLRNVTCPISINASAEVLSSKDVLQRLENVFRSVDLPNHLLKIEVTENTNIPDLTTLAAELSRMQSAGFGISIDDFGVGFSSMQRLISLPFTELKIDRTFVQHLEHCPASEAVIHALLVLGRKLGIRIIAEGIETEGQAIRLQSLGCDYGQGFGLSPPLEVDAFISKMDNCI